MLCRLRIQSYQYHHPSSISVLLKLSFNRFPRLILLNLPFSIDLPPTIHPVGHRLSLRQAYHPPQETTAWKSNPTQSEWHAFPPHEHHESPTYPSLAAPSVPPKKMARHYPSASIPHDGRTRSKTRHRKLLCVTSPSPPPTDPSKPAQQSTSTSPAPAPPPTSWPHLRRHHHPPRHRPRPPAPPTSSPALLTG